MRIIEHINAHGAFTIAITTERSPLSTRYLIAWREVEGGLLQLSSDDPRDLQPGDYFVAGTTAQKFCGVVREGMSDLAMTLITKAHNLAPDYHVIAYSPLPATMPQGLRHTPCYDAPPAELATNAYLERGADVQFLSVVDWGAHNSHADVQDGWCISAGHTKAIKVSEYIREKHKCRRIKMSTPLQVLEDRANDLAEEYALDANYVLRQLICADQLKQGQADVFDGIELCDDRAIKVTYDAQFNHWTDGQDEYWDDEEELLTYVQFL